MDYHIRCGIIYMYYSSLANISVWIRYQTLYSDLKFQIIYNFDTYLHNYAINKNRI